MHLRDNGDVGKGGGLCDRRHARLRQRGLLWVWLQRKAQAQSCHDTTVTNIREETELTIKMSSRILRGR